MMNRNKLESSAVFFHSVYFGRSIRAFCADNDPCVFSEDEIRRMVIDVLQQYNSQQLDDRIKKFIGYFAEKTLSKRTDLDFYDVLFEFADSLITRFEGRYCFRYEFADIWRRLTKEIDEETFVAAAVAKSDLRRSINRRKHMDWSYCVEHDNREIKMMLQRDSGISENHMHLRCSSPYYYMSWVYLMNNLDNSKFSEMFAEMKKSTLKKYPNEENEYPLELTCKRAAVIRLYLYCIICETYFSEYNANTVEDISKSKLLEDIVFSTSDENDICTFPVNKVQDYIIQFNTAGDIDYAQSLLGIKDTLYYDLSGERSIVYYSLKMIMEKSVGFEVVKKLLFLYLLMKQRFRTEIVQSNDRVGFYNFAEYEGRKDYFMFETVQNEESLAVDAICSICDDMKYHRIEMRISPKMTWQKLSDAIKLYDGAINKALKLINPKRKMNCSRNFFYTLHFPKENFKPEKGVCRHYGLRNKTAVRARSITELRKYADYSISSRVLGIDACSHEMDCRPEVFGLAFRYLQDYEPEHKTPDKKKLRQLKSTYHVAEDNYDVVDGLRAIYEAVYFLGLRSGSRLGHATLLGMPPVKYYSKHDNTVSMPRQVFLDNMMWLYYFVSDNNITFENNALLFSYLNNQFRIHFNKIYVDDIQSCFVDDILDEAKKSYLLDFPEDRKTYSKESCDFSIYHYHLAYLLRGDDPELYKSGFLLKKCDYSEEYRICNTHTDMGKARRNFEANYLYYLYHYSDRVKERGEEIVEETLPEYVIRAIDIVQEKMKRLISEYGIGIETNPTSNIFISIADNYSEHPISNLYDHSLSKNLRNVQMNLSINTDDKSTFSTCLSNEYAYLLHYYEHKKDADGNYMYSRSEIMRWLDEIRKMGNDQSFGN